MIFKKEKFWKYKKIKRNSSEKNPHMTSLIKTPPCLSDCRSPEIECWFMRPFSVCNSEPGRGCLIEIAMFTEQSAQQQAHHPARLHQRQQATWGGWIRYCSAGCVDKWKWENSSGDKMSVSRKNAVKSDGIFEGSCNNALDWPREYRSTLWRRSVNRFVNVGHWTCPFAVASWVLKGQRSTGEILDGSSALRLCATNLQRNDVPRVEPPYPPRLGCQEHSRVQQKQGEDFRLRVVTGFRRRQRLLQDKLQREFETADRLVRTGMCQLLEVHQRFGRVGLRSLPLGDVFLWISALAGIHRSSNPRSNWQAQLPTPGTAGMLPERVLHADVEVLESRSTETSKILGNLSTPSRHEAWAAENDYSIRRAEKRSLGVSPGWNRYGPGQISKFTLLAGCFEFWENRPLQPSKYRRIPWKSSLVKQ